MRTLLAAVVLLAWSARALADEYTIEVRARTESKSPLPELPFVLVVNGQRLADGITDQDGKLILTTEVLDDGAYITLGFAEKKATPEYTEWLKRYHDDLRHKYHFAQRYPVVLGEGQDTAPVDVVAWDAVQLKARIVDGRGVPRRGEVYGSLYSYPALGPAGTTLRIPDLRRAAPLLVIVTSWVERSAQLLHAVQLTADDTADDVDLGEVVIPARQRGVTLDVTLAGEQHLRNQGEHTPIPGVVFVAGDGETGVCYRAAPVGNDLSTLRLLAADDEPAHLQPGRHYIAAGYFLNTETQRALFEIVRDGKPEELEKLYSIDVTEDGYIGTIDLWAAYQGIRSVMNSREEKKKQDQQQASRDAGDIDK